MPRGRDDPPDGQGPGEPVSRTAPTDPGPRRDEARTLVQPEDALDWGDADGTHRASVEDAVAAAAAGEARYEQLEEIGRGGMGTVHRAFDRLLRRRVAKKAIQESVASAEFVRGFIQEAQISGQLDHPSIVPVYDLGFEGANRAFFTMKLVEGRTLEAAIAELHAEDFDGALLDGILRVLLKVCEAVSFAHSRGVVHCDLKPANVMIGTHGQVYVMDWGLGLLLSSRRSAVAHGTDPETRPGITTSGSTRSQTPSLAGTVSYMAPEQASGGFDAIDQRTDVFALGATLYEVLTGRAPYEAQISKGLAQARDATVVPPDERSERPLPPALCEIAMKALQRDPADRHQDVEELHRDLELFLLGGGWFATRTYAPGEVVVLEGDPGDAAYVLVSGRCEVSRQVGGERRVLRVLDPGDVFGEMALLSENRRTATVTALDDVTVKLITAAAFERELGRSSLVRAIVKQLSARFLELERRGSNG